MYGITKHAVVAISESLYLQLKQHGANTGVSVLCPDSVSTRIFERDRNRPADLRNDVEPPGRGDGHTALVWMQEHGMDPALVADKAIQAIKDGRLYVLTHEGNEQLVGERMQTIIEGRNPELPAPRR